MTVRQKIRQQPKIFILLAILFVACLATLPYLLREENPQFAAISSGEAERALQPWLNNGFIFFSGGNTFISSVILGLILSLWLWRKLLPKGIGNLALAIRLVLATIFQLILVLIWLLFSLGLALLTGEKLWKYEVLEHDGRSYYRVTVDGNGYPEHSYWVKDGIFAMRRDSSSLSYWNNREMITKYGESKRPYDSAESSLESSTSPSQIDAAPVTSRPALAGSATPSSVASSDIDHKFNHKVLGKDYYYSKILRGKVLFSEAQDWINHNLENLNRIDDSAYAWVLIDKAGPSEFVMLAKQEGQEWRFLTEFPDTHGVESAAYRDHKIFIWNYSGSYVYDISAKIWQ